MEMSCAQRIASRASRIGDFAHTPMLSSRKILRKTPILDSETARDYMIGLLNVGQNGGKEDPTSRMSISYATDDADTAIEARPKLWRKFVRLIHGQSGPFAQDGKN